MCCKCKKLKDHELCEKQCGGINLLEVDLKDKIAFDTEHSQSTFETLYVCKLTGHEINPEECIYRIIEVHAYELQSIKSSLAEDKIKLWGIGHPIAQINELLEI